MYFYIIIWILYLICYVIHLDIIRFRRYDGFVLY